MTLIELKELLITIGVPVFHYHAHKQSGEYIVWAEDGEGASGHADNHKTLIIIQGTIDYFTKKEFDKNIQLIEYKLNSVDLAWKLNSIQPEKHTGYIHYEWVWEMI